MRLKNLIPLLLGATILGACADDSVIFVTSTSIGLDGDANTQSANIGYNRQEGVYAPVYANGATPPVYGYLKSDLAIFSPKIKQVYATGDAALIATKFMDGPPKVTDETPVLTGKIGPQMEFGTFTHFGFKIGFEGTAPKNVTLGYKRYEASRIPPVPLDKEGRMAYGSVLASVDIAAGAGSTDSNPTFSNYQYFGTGGAAEALAANPEIRTRFEVKAKAALTSVEFDSGDPSINRFAACMNSDFKVMKPKWDAYAKKNIPALGGKDPKNELFIVFSGDARFKQDREQFSNANCPI